MKRKLCAWIDVEIYELVYRLADWLGVRPNVIVEAGVALLADALGFSDSALLKLKKLEALLSQAKALRRIARMREEILRYSIEAEKSGFAPLKVVQAKINEEVKRIYEELQREYMEEAKRLEEQALLSFERSLEEAIKLGYDYWCPSCRAYYSLSMLRDLRASYDQDMNTWFCPFCNRKLRKISELVEERGMLMCPSCRSVFEKSKAVAVATQHGVKLLCPFCETGVKWLANAVIEQIDSGTIRVLSETGEELLTCRSVQELTKQSSK